MTEQDATVSNQMIGNEMPRSRQYDEDEVLASAMRFFWEHGYGATTRELADAMGINQYSVYASFESKAGLFARCLDHYFDLVETSVLLPLMSEEAGMPELQQFLESFVFTKQLDAPDGCLICNTMIDQAGHTKPVLRTIRRYRKLVCQRFTHALNNSFPSMPDSVVHARTEFLYGALMGLFVQKKMGIEGAPIQTLVDEIMAAVQRDYI
jgi:TetR/AcrR family transcriptional repressor of nem operon